MLAARAKRVCFVLAIGDYMLHEITHHCVAGQIAWNSLNFMTKDLYVTTVKGHRSLTHGIRLPFSDAFSASSLNTNFFKDLVLYGISSFHHEDGIFFI